MKVGGGGKAVDVYAVGTEKYFQQVILRELVELAMDPGSSQTHESVIRAMSIIVVKSGTKSRFVLPKVGVVCRCPLKSNRAYGLTHQTK